MVDIVRPLPRHGSLIRSLALQGALILIVGVLAGGAIYNAAKNMARVNIAHGFGFWNNTAGFDISQSLISYSSSTSTFGRAFWIGLLNTLLVAALGIVFATDHRFCRWLGTTIAKLAGRAACQRLCRSDPKHSALVANPVLVQCGSEIAT